MKEIKREILEKARALFNVHGIANITHRRIAMETGISHGNLNYHFKKRDDLLEALYFEMVEAFDNRITDLKTVKIDLRHVYEESLTSMERMVDYRFIWIDLAQLLRENENIRNHFIDARTRRKNGYLFVFKQLEADKIFRGENYKGEYLNLINRLLIYSDFWLVSNNIYNEKTDKNLVGKHHQVFFEMFYPFLTKKGEKDYSKMVEVEK